MANPVTYNPDVPIDTNAVSNRLPRNAAVPLDNTGAAVAAFGSSLDNLGVALQRNQQQAAARVDQDAVNTAQVSLAKFQLGEQQQFEAAKESLNSPDADPHQFISDYMRGYDQRAASFASQFDNVKARQFADLHTSRLAVETQGQALRFAATRIGELQGERIAAVTGDYSRYVQNDPNSFQAIRDVVEQMVADSRVVNHEHYRAGAVQKLAFAATQGRLQADPVGFLARVLPPGQLDSIMVQADGPTSAIPGATLPNGVAPSMSSAQIRAAALEAQKTGLDTFMISGQDASGKYVPIPMVTADYFAPKASQPLVVPTPVERSGLPEFDALDVPARIAAVHEAQTLVHQQQARQQSGLQVMQHDASAMAMDGRLYPGAASVNYQTFLNAYGPENAPRVWATWQDTQKTAAGVAALWTATPETMAATLKAAEPQDGPGYAEQAHNAEIVRRSAEIVMTARQKDPILAAVRGGLGNVQPIDLGNPDQSRAELQNRTAIATRMIGYGSPNLGALTAREATVANEHYERATPAERLAILGTLSRGIPNRDVYLATVRSIRPDSPVTLMAAAINAKAGPGSDVQNLTVPGGFFSADASIPATRVAQTLIAGEDMLNTTKGAKREDGRPGPIKLPEADIVAKLSKDYGEALGADPTGRTYQEALQGVRAYYAASALAKGKLNDVTVDTPTLNEAMAAVLGTPVERGGRKVLAPWGWNTERFNGAVDAAYAKAMHANGYNGTAFDVPDKYQLMQTGEYRYLLTIGDKGLLGRDGLPVLLDLSATGATPGQSVTRPMPAPISPTQQPGQRMSSGKIR